MSPVAEGLRKVLSRFPWALEGLGLPPAPVSCRVVTYSCYERPWLPWRVTMEGYHGGLTCITVYPSVSTVLLKTLTEED